MAQRMTLKGAEIRSEADEELLGSSRHKVKTKKRDGGNGAAQSRKSTGRNRRY